LKALVTGANSFLGRRLIKDLLENGHVVIAVVRPGVDGNNRPRMNNGNVIVVPCGLESYADLPERIGFPCDWFFHLAWAGVYGYDRGVFAVQEKNISSAVQAVTAAKALGCSRFIGAGSVREAECRIELELSKVPDTGNLSKGAKLYAHYVCMLEAAKLGIDFIWLLFSNLYGPGERNPSILNLVMRALLKGQEPALTNGAQLYDFIYVDDAASAFRLAAEKGTSFENYMISGGDVKPLRDYITRLRDLVSPGASLGFGKAGFSGVCLERDVFDNGNLFRDTCFKPQMSFDKGVMLLKEYIEAEINAGV